MLLLSVINNGTLKTNNSDTLNFGIKIVTIIINHGSLNVIVINSNILITT